MSITRTRRTVLPAVAAVALLLSSSPAGAARSTWDFSGWLRSVLSTIWGESGCSADPSGQCGAAPAPVDSGCAWDPNGGCKQ